MKSRTEYFHSFFCDNCKDNFIIVAGKVFEREKLYCPYCGHEHFNVSTEEVK